jgi:rod shape determining protein RodA
MKQNQFLKLDFPLIITCLALLTIGLIAVYSATHTFGLEETNYFKKQLSIAFSAVALMFLVAFLPFRWLSRFSYVIYGLSIFLLILVLFTGSRGFGAERWLIFGPLKLQPSELAKLTTILAVANFISKPQIDINRLKHLFIAVGLIIIPALFIARQPDLGTSLVFLALCLPLLFWAGLNWFYLFIIITPFITMILSFNFYAFLVWMILIITILIFSARKPYILISIFLLHIFMGLMTPILWNQLKPYQQKRILTFMSPEDDPKGAGYQIIQSKVAIGSGGIWGKGFLDGSQTQLRFLPAQHTDFIFSVIGEEWGFMGVSIIICLFLVLLLYLIYLAGLVRSLFSSLTIIGITTVLFFHIIINIGMSVGLAPVTGLPLPFISYGGSFLIMVFLMIGVVLNVSLNRFLV